MNNEIKIDFSKNCKAIFSVGTLKEVINWYSVGTYEDYQSLFKAANITNGNRNSLYGMSQIGNAIFELCVNDSGKITKVEYFAVFNETEETRKAGAKLFVGKFRFNF